MHEAIKTRLEAQVPVLNRRTRFSADLAALFAGSDLPARTTAYVLLSGLRGGQPSAMAGLFQQPMTKTTSIVLVCRTTSQRAEAAVDDVEDLIRDVQTAMAGWSPDTKGGVFQFNSGQVLGFNDGALFFGLDFQINDELRIAS